MFEGGGLTAALFLKVWEDKIMEYLIGMLLGAAIMCIIACIATIGEEGEHDKRRYRDKSQKITLPRDHR